MTDRIDQCQAIAKVLQQAAPALKESPIQDHPEPKELRRRARLYGQLSARLSKVPLTRKELKKEVTVLSRDLLALEKELHLAAEIVSRHSQAGEERKKLPHSDKEGSPTNEGSGAAPERGGTSKPTSLSPPDDPSPGRTRVVAGLLRPSSTPDPWERKEQNFIREYARARRTAQGVGRSVQEAVLDLNKACR